MNITISGIDGLKEAVLAAGIKELLQGMDGGIAVAIEKRESLPQPAPSPAVEEVKQFVRKVRAKAAPAPVKRAAKAPATSGGGERDGHDTRRHTRGAEYLRQGSGH